MNKEDECAEGFTGQNELFAAVRRVEKHGFNNDDTEEHFAALEVQE